MTRTMTIADIEVPRVGLGTNRLTTDAAHVDFIREAVEAGVRHIDTAHLYQGGTSEQTIGRSGVASRDDVLVATKGGFGDGEGQPEVLRAQIEQSLRSLKVDTIDLWYLHKVDPQTPLEQSLEVVRGFCERGQIRQVGLSNVAIEQIQVAREIVPVAAVQNEYSLAERDGHDVLTFCEQAGIAFVPFFPLRGGEGVADEIAARHGVRPNAVKIAWLLQRSPVMAPIPGTLSADHLRENLAADDLALSGEDIAALDG